MTADAVPRVSIVIPAFNAEPYIGTSLTSVLAQTYHDYEVIVVDDGSTDDTKAVVLAAGGPIRYMQQRNQGPAAARNTGIEAARGELVCFLDADDSWHPDKLAIQMEFMERHADVGLLFSDEEEFDEQGTRYRSLVSTSRFYREMAAAPLVDRPFQKLLEENFIPTSMVIARKFCFQRAGGFDVTLKGPEDRDMWSRIAAQYPVAFIPRVLGRKRAVASSVSRNVEMTLRSRIRMWTKARHSFPDLASAETVNALLAPTYIQLGFVLLQQGKSREAREMAVKGFGASRTPHSWLLASSLIVFTFAGRACTAFAFDTRRRVLQSRGSGTES